MSSSLFPLNMLPVMTSIQPEFGRCWLMSISYSARWGPFDIPHLPPSHSLLTRERRRARGCAPRLQPKAVAPKRLRERERPSPAAAGALSPRKVFTGFSVDADLVAVVHE